MRPVSVCVVLWACVAEAGLGRDVALWPLDEGQGSVLKDTIGGVSGVLHAAGPEKPIWRDGGLVFPGGKGGGSVRVAGGGTLLSGPFFAVSLEVRPADATSPGSLVCTKHGSWKKGGWLVSYWGAARRLTVMAADGAVNHTFEFSTGRPLPPGEWSRIDLLYDGAQMRFLLNDKFVKAIDKAGIVLKTSTYPLLVGGYYNELGVGFKGAIRNVRLSVPQPEQGGNSIVLVRDLGRPEIDGKLDDATWHQADFITDFVRFTPDQPAPLNTEFAVAADGQRLYLAVRCHEPFPQRIKAPERPRDELVGDSVEIFLQPDLGGHHFIQLALTAAGVQYDCLMSHHGTRVRTDFDLEWTSAAGREPEAWTAELAIPFSQLLVRAPGQGTWKMNVCRNIATLGDKVVFTTWGQVPEGQMKSFHNPNIFRFATGFPALQHPAAEELHVRAGRKKWALDEKPSRQKNALLAIHDPWFVPNNLNAPNWLMNLAGGRTILAQGTSYVLDLPEGISIVAVGHLLGSKAKPGQTKTYTLERAGTVQHEGRAFQRYVVRPVDIHRNNIDPGPFFLRSRLAHGTESSLYYFAQWEGGQQEMQRLDLVTKTFPTPGKPRALIAPIAWMFATRWLAWPDFHSSYAKLGFNMVATHGLYDRVLEPEQVQTALETARQNGFRTLYVDSPFHPIMNRPETVSQLMKPKAEKHNDLCPSYRGPVYQAEVGRLATMALAARADEITLDIECYGFGAFAGKSGQCQRCNADVHRRGKPAAEAVLDMGTEILHDVHRAVGDTFTAGGLPVPGFGTYHTQPGGFVYEDLFDYDRMDKRRVARCHPVYYSSGKAEAIGRELRRLRRLTDGTQIIPWMSGGYSNIGYQVEYPSVWVYDRVLENYGSGICGIYWFAYQKFEAADLYYYAKAMEAVAPVAELVCDSRPLDGIRCDKPTYSVTGIRNGQDTLLLVSNYRQPVPMELRISLTEGVTGHLWDLTLRRSAGPVSGRHVVVCFKPGVEGGHTALYYIGLKEM